MADLPLADVTRLSRYGFQARQAERYRDGRILPAGEPAGAGAPALREALARWFGTPPNTTLPIIDRSS